MYMPEYYEELDKEAKQRIIDYFDAWDLVEFLGISTEDVVDAFEAEIEERLDDIEEMMEYNRGKTE